MKSTGLVYVRTASGTVKLLEGEAVPADADVDHVERLAGAGLLADEPRSGKAKEQTARSVDEGEPDPA